MENNEHKYGKTHCSKSVTEQWNDITFIRPTYPYLDWIPVYKSEDVQRTKDGSPECKIGKEQSDETKLGENILTDTFYEEEGDGPSKTKGSNENVPGRHVEILYIRTDQTDYVTESLKRQIRFSDETEDEFCGMSLHLPCKIFNDFLTEAVTKGDARYPIDGEGKNVCMFVEDAVDKLRDFLDCQFRMFKGCKILKTGSSYEKTKIGKPDEFDFMIEVPVLATNGAILFSLFDDETGDIPGLVSCDIVNPTFFQDICTHPMSEYNQLQDGFFKPTDLTLGYDFCSLPIVKILLVRISQILRNKLNEILPKEVKYQGIHLQPMVEKAMTFTMIWKGDTFDWLPVSVDFVLGIPLKRSESLNIPGDRTYHAVFHNHASRISCSLLEIDIFRSFSLEDGQNKCMRILKLFRDRYTPKEFAFYQERLEISKQLLIPTFWLKHIMLYMYKKYEHTKDTFNEDQLPFRIVEALEILGECCRRHVLNSFFIPNCNLMSVDGDDRERKVENFELIRTDIEELIAKINNLEENKMALHELQKIIKSRDQLTQTWVDEMFFDYLIRKLGQYAARGYTQDELSVLKACCLHINDFSGGDYVITGEGTNIVFMVRGKHVDIVEELLKMHKQEMVNKLKPPINNSRDT